MIRIIRGLLLGTLVVVLGLGSMGCQGGGGDPGSKEEGVKKAKQAAEGMKQGQEQREKNRGGAGTGGGADEEDQKEKEKAKDKKGG